MSSSPDNLRPTGRLVEVKSSLSDIINRISIAAESSPHPPTLVAVSKYKPASDIAAAYEAGQRDFGENYANEVLEKAPLLPFDIRWHFIGHLQSNKAKALAAIPNLHALHTLTSIKLATALDKARASAPPLNVFLQVNTSGEDAKFGLPPLDSRPSFESIPSDDSVLTVARHVITSCPNLRFNGLMTIGSLENSTTAGDQNQDFQTLLRTREVLKNYLRHNNLLLPSNSNDRSSWEDQGDRLILSMGMSSDFEAAIRAGSGVVRIGTGIFGERSKKNADANQTS